MKKQIKQFLIWLRIFYQIKDRSFFGNHTNQVQRTFYQSFIDKDGIVFDVGANVGQRAFIFKTISKLTIAFEPQPSCIAILKSRFAYINNVIISPIALSHTKGMAQMHLSDASTLSTLSDDFVKSKGNRIFKQHNWDRKIQVPTDTLDNQIKKFGMPSFIKIDVEGFEESVLKGLTIEGPHISFEFIPNDLEKTFSCLRIIHQISSRYKFNMTLGENLNFVFTEHLAYPDFKKVDELKNAGTFGDIYAIYQ